MAPDLGKQIEPLASSWLKNEGRHMPSWMFEDCDDGHNVAKKMFGWIASDFGAKVSGERFLPERLISELGPEAAKVLDSAIKAARQEGIEIDNAAAKDMLAQAKEASVSEAGDAAALRRSLKYSAKSSWSDKMIERFARELRKNKGDVDKDDMEWLSSQVTDVDGLLKHFKKPSAYYRAENILKKPKFEEGGSVDDDGDASGDNAVAIDDRATNEFNEKQFGSAVAESRQHLAKGQYFDLRTDEGRKGAEAVSAYHSAKDSDGASVRTIARIGIVDRELEKLAETRNTPIEGLKKVSIDALKRKIVHHYFPDMRQLPQRPKIEAPLARRRYEEEKAKYEKAIESRANLLNRKVVSLALDKSETKKMGLEFSDKDISELHLKNRDIRNATNGPQNGTLVFERKGKDGEVAKRPFVTSTRMLAAKMFRLTDGSADSSKDYQGSAQSIMQLLSDAITSVLVHPQFTGKVGTVVDGKVIWELPDSMVIGIDKGSGTQHTIGLAKQQAAKQSAKSLRDMWPSEMRQAVANLLNNLEISTDLEFQEAQEALRMSAKEEQHALLKKVFKKWLPEEESHLIPDREADFDPDETIQYQGQTEIQVGTDTLADYDPEKGDLIYRDNYGFSYPDAPTIKAAHMVGTPKPVRQEDAKQFDPALKPFPTLLSTDAQNTAAERLQDAKDWIAQTMFDLDKMLIAIEHMSATQLIVLNAALFGKDSRKGFRVLLAPSKTPGNIAYRSNTEKRLGAQTDNSSAHSGIIQIGLKEISKRVLAKQYFGNSLSKANKFISIANSEEVRVKSWITFRYKEVANGLVRQDATRSTGKAGKANAGGSQAGVAEGNLGGGSATNGELGASGQGRESSGGVSYRGTLMDDSKIPTMRVLPGLPPEAEAAGEALDNQFDPNAEWVKVRRQQTEDWLEDQRILEEDQLIRARLKEISGKRS